MNLNSFLAKMRWARFEVKKMRLELNRNKRKSANDIRRTYRALDGLVDEVESFVKEIRSTDEFDKVEREIQENEERKKQLK